MDVKRRSAGKRKLAIAARQAARVLPHNLPPIWALSDPARRISPAALAAALPPGWGLICRHFGEMDALSETVAAVSVCKARHVRVLIGSDPELAMTTGADGVHWPERERGTAKKWRGAFNLMTTSAHSPAAVRYAKGFDAVLYSAVFASNSPTADAPMGVFRYRAAVRSAPVPVIALGGIGPDTVRSVASHGGAAAVEQLARLYV